MKLCKTCMHWKYKETSYSSYQNDEICSPVDSDCTPMIMPFKVNMCSNPKQVLFERPVLINGFALCDGSDYRAKMYTAEEFGCVLHEEK